MNIKSLLLANLAAISISGFTLANAMPGELRITNKSGYTIDIRCNGIDGLSIRNNGSTNRFFDMIYDKFKSTHLNCAFIANNVTVGAGRFEITSPPGFATGVISALEIPQFKVTVSPGIGVSTDKIEITILKK